MVSNNNITRRETLMIVILNLATYVMRNNMGYQISRILNNDQCYIVKSDTTAINA